MADAFRHHKSRGQKFAFDRQCTARSSLNNRCKGVFQYIERQNLCFWHEDVEKQMAKAQQMDIFTSVFENLSKLV